MKKGWFSRLVLMTAVLMVLCGTGVWAKTGSNGKGAVFPKYKKTVVLTMKDPNLWKKLGYKKKTKMSTETFLDDALRAARRHATRKVRYKVVVPPGRYRNMYMGGVPSNTCLYAKGATFVYSYAENPFEGMGKENVLIQGGTWDCSARSTGGYTLVPLCHRKNIAFKNVTLKGNCLSHIMEFADINGLTFSGCTISGNSKGTLVQPKEAVELDVADPAAVPSSAPFNGKGCHNVLFEKCTFKNVARGVGSHNFLEGSVEIENPSFRNVTFRNNTFKNCEGEGIFILHMKNVTISGNKIIGAKRTGIYVEDCTNVLIQKNKISKVTAYTGERTIYGTYKTGVAVAVSDGVVVKNNVLSATPGAYQCFSNLGNKNVTASDNLLR